MFVAYRNTLASEFGHQLAVRLQAISSNVLPSGAATLGLLADAPHVTAAQLDGLALVGCVRLHNRAELMRRLQPHAAAPLDAASDGLLLLWAYRVWGWRMAAQLVGPFAFALWDAGAQTLLLVRDPVGLQPLYYHTAHGVLASDDVGAILRALPTTPDYNTALLKDHLCNVGHRWQSETPYVGIATLPPGCVLLCQPTPVVQRYHTWADVPAVRYQRQEEYNDRLRELLAQALAANLPESGAVGVLLSGGLDSSSLAAMLHTLPAAQGRDIRLYATVTERYRDADEREYVDAVAAQCTPWPLRTLRYEDMQPAPGLPDALPRDPFGLRILGARVLHAADDGCPVLLSGTGGDQIFSHSLYFEPRALLALQPRAMRHELPIFKSAAGGYWRLLRALISGSMPPAPRPCLLRDHHATPQPPVPRRTPLLVRHALPGLGGAFLHRLALYPALARVMGPRAVDVRFPYLDQRLMAFCFGVPVAQWLTRGWTRSLQRRALKGILPEVIRQRATKAAVNEQLHDLLCQGADMQHHIAHSTLVRWGWFAQADLVALWRAYCADEQPLAARTLLAFWELEAWLATQHGVNPG